jgi:hypothetical protein
MKRPAYQWYPADAESDEVYRLMTYEQEGVYRRLLDHQWMEGSIPSDPQVIASLLPKMARDRFLEIWPLVSGKFRPRGTDRLVNDKLEIQRRELDKYVKGQRVKSAKGVAARKLQAKKPQPAGQPTGQPVVRPESRFGSTSSTPSSTPSVEQKISPAEKAPGGVKEFLTWFQGEYKARRNGATYFVKWEAHGAIVKRLLTAFPSDRLKKHAQILLTTDEDWTTTTDRGVEILSSKINWLEERLCAWEAKRRAREAV